MSANLDDLFDKPRGSNLPQRSNNPGAIRPVDSSGYNQYSSPEEGFQALQKEISNKITGRTRTGLNPNSSLYDFFNVWAPWGDGANNPTLYARNVAARLGVSPDTKVGSLLNRVPDIARAIATQEGYYGKGAISSTSTPIDDLLDPLDDLFDKQEAPKVKVTYPDGSKKFYPAGTQVTYQTKQVKALQKITVGKNDTIESLAKKYGIADPMDILRINSLYGGLEAGQQIKVPVNKTVKIPIVNSRKPARTLPNIEGVNYAPPQYSRRVDPSEFDYKPQEWQKENRLVEVGGKAQTEPQPDVRTAFNEALESSGLLGPTTMFSRVAKNTARAFEIPDGESKVDNFVDKAYDYATTGGLVGVLRNVKKVMGLKSDVTPEQLAQDELEVRGRLTRAGEDNPKLAAIARASEGLTSEILGSLSNVTDYIPAQFGQDVTDYLRRKASVMGRAASETPIDEKGNPKPQNLGDEVLQEVTLQGLNLAKFIALQRLTGASPTTIMVSEAALQSVDKSATEREQAITKAFAFGKVVENLGGSPQNWSETIQKAAKLGTGFGAQGAAETYLQTGDPRKALVSGLGGSILGAGLGLSEGRTLKDHPKTELIGKPIIAETQDGRVVVPNENNKSGVSVVKERDVPQLRYAVEKQGKRWIVRDLETGKAGDFKFLSEEKAQEIALSMQRAQAAQKPKEGLAQTTVPERPSQIDDLFDTPAIKEQGQPSDYEIREEDGWFRVYRNNKRITGFNQRPLAETFIENQLAELKAAPVAESSSSPSETQNQATPIEPEIVGTSEGVRAKTVNAERKAIYEMTPDELDAAYRAEKKREQNIEVELFGEEGAKRYRTLQRKANSVYAPFEETNQAYAEVEKMEAGLPERDRSRLYGIGEKDTPSAEDYRDYRSALGRIDPSSEQDLADSIKYALTKLGGKTEPSSMNETERMAYAQLRYAAEVARREGYDTARITEQAVRAAASRFNDPEDAVYMLRHLFTDTSGMGDAVPEAKRLNAQPTPVPERTSKQPRGRATLDPTRMSLSEAVRALGGVRIDKDAANRGEVNRLSQKESGTSGLVNNKTGMSAEEVGQALAEAGYFGKPQEGTSELDPNELLAKIEEDASGSSKYYSSEKDWETTFRDGVDALPPDSPERKEADFFFNFVGDTEVQSIVDRIERGEENISDAPRLQQIASYLGVAAEDAESIIAEARTSSRQGESPSPVDVQGETESYKEDSGTPGQIEDLFDSPTRETLQSSVVPGVKEFVEQDVVPKIKTVIKGVIDTAKAVRNILFPRSAASTESVDAVMGMKGDRDRQAFELEVQGQERKDRFNQMKRADVIRFLDDFKRGLPQRTPELQRDADTLRTIDDEVYNELKTRKPSLPYLDDHFRILWKEIPGQMPQSGIKGLFGRRPLRGSQGWAKQHTLTDLSEGLRWELDVPTADLQARAAKAGLTTDDIQIQPGKAIRLTMTSSYAGGQTDAIPLSEKGRSFLLKEESRDTPIVRRGGEPVSYNPQTLIELSYADAMKFITAHDMFEWAKQNGYAKFYKNQDRGKVPDNFTELNDRLAKVYFKSPQGMVDAGEYFIEENFGRLLNNFLSRDFIREMPVGQGLVWVKNQMTQFELGFSAFHAMFEGMESVSSNLGIGMRRMVNLGLLKGDVKEFGKGLAQIPKSVTAPYETARLGGDVLRYTKDPLGFASTERGKAFLKEYPEIDNIIRDMFRGGAKGQRVDRELFTNTREAFKQAVTNGNYPGALIRALPALNEYVMHPLFEEFIPRLKFGLFLKEYSLALRENEGRLNSGNLTREQLARKTWDFVEDRFGEMNFDNLFWDRTFKTAAQVMFRSVTWKIGNLRASVGALPEQMGEFRSAYKESRAPTLQPKLAWLASQALVTTIVGTAIMKIATGLWPENLKDVVYPRTDAYDPRQRVSVPTYIKDSVSMYHSPTDYIASSASSEFSRAMEAYRNKDYFGEPIRDPKDPYYQQAWDEVEHFLPTPFAVTSAVRSYQQGQPAWKSVASFAGLTKAPSWVSQTPAESLMMEISTGKRSETPPSREDFQRFRLKGQLEERMRRGEDVSQEVDQAIQDSRLKPSDVEDITRSSKLSRTQANFNKLGLEQALDVYEIMNEAEREEVKGIISKKTHLLDNVPLNKRAELEERIKRLGIEALPLNYRT